MASLLAEARYYSLRTEMDGLVTKRAVPLHGPETIHELSGREPVSRSAVGRMRWRGAHSAARALYRRCWPHSLRHLSITSSLKHEFVRFLEWAGGPDAVYDDGYFREVVEPAAAQSAGAIAQSIVRDLAPLTVLDVGCGTGTLLEAFRAQGCSVEGLERAAAALDVCHQRGLKVRPFDLETDSLKLSNKFDIVISLEVAEHLPPTAADRFVRLLARASNVVILSAARPGQGGLDHRNEQPPEYWIERFAQFAFAEEISLRERWRSEWASCGVASWYHQNLLVLARKGGPSEKA